MEASVRITRVWPPVALLALGGGGCAGTPPPVVTWAQIIAQPVPPSGERIAYGPDSLQFGELRVPAGAGPHPLVVILHGGCWQSAYGVGHVAPLAEALTREGFATWAIEYRRIGDPGGGWPGTFEDAAVGVDHVRELARTHAIDLERIVLLGHSAGGHLALWAASRGRMPAGSELSGGVPLPVRGVVTLAGIAGLAAYGTGAGSCNASVTPLMGGAIEEVPERYAAGDPMRLVPPSAPVRLVQGAADPIVPLEQAEAYVRAAGAAGGDARVVLVPGAGHFALIAPFSPAWRKVVAEVHAAAKGSRTP
jgi:acetyl esterase/lipase